LGTCGTLHLQGTGGLTFAVSFALVGIHRLPRSDAFSTHAFGRGKFTIEWVHTSVSSM